MSHGRWFVEVALAHAPVGIVVHALGHTSALPKCLLHGQVGHVVIDPLRNETVDVLLLEVDGLEHVEHGVEVLRDTSRSESVFAKPGYHHTTQLEGLAFLLSVLRGSMSFLACAQASGQLNILPSRSVLVYELTA